MHAALPDDAEVAGLLALMLLTDARRPARTGPHGELVPLAEQDRTRWDRALIREGVALITDALRRGAIGEYQVQAAIAAVHDQAPRYEDTDWREILALYRVLERMTDNPMVTLNRAVATAMVDGPDAGLAVVDVAAERARRPPPRRTPSAATCSSSPAIATSAVVELRLRRRPAPPAPASATT